MRKMKLDLDMLVVESFNTVKDAQGFGTVRGNEDTQLCSQYCASAPETCAILSCAESACGGAGGTFCGCAATVVGTCVQQISCAGGQCAQSAWCQYMTMGYSCQTCPDDGCEIRDTSAQLCL